MNIYYVYVYRYPETKIPFYVGLGKNDRMRDHLTAAKRKSTKPNHKINTIRKILSEGKEPIIEILENNLSKETAVSFERFFISEFGRRDLNTGSLCNLTSGGDGVRDMGPLTKKAISDSRSGKTIFKHSISGCVVSLSINDPKVLSGEFVGVNKNSISVKTALSSLYKGTTLVRTQGGDIIRVSVDDPRLISGDLVGIKKGIPSIKHQSTNVKVVIKDPNTLEVIKVFDSLGDASGYLNHNKSVISAWSKKNVIRDGVLFTRG